MLSLSLLLTEFEQTLGVRFLPPAALADAAESLIRDLAASEPNSVDYRRGELIRQLNAKFRFNADGMRRFLGVCAKAGVTFNYHEKLEIAKAFDSSSAPSLERVLDGKFDADFDATTAGAIRRAFDPISQETSLELLYRELQSPTLTRKDSRPRDWSVEILSSLFAAYSYAAFPEFDIHKRNDPLTRLQHYEADFWRHLHNNFPSLFSRTNTLTVIDVERVVGTQPTSYAHLRDEMLRLVRNAHGALANHGYLAVTLSPATIEEQEAQWLLAADITLYAEKHLACRIKQSFFKWREIEAVTRAHIPDLPSAGVEFDLCNQGFLYQDCWVLGEGREQRLLLLLQKSVADETVIPCPSCRSHDVQGNSYSSLGVRSWECNNILCPDRTKFNRGKRYSFLQLLKQQAIQDPRATIPTTSVREWMKDVRPPKTSRQILEMLIRHYSLPGDGFVTVGLSGVESNFLGRRHDARSVDQTLPDLETADVIQPQSFFDAAYFRRFCVASDSEATGTHAERLTVDGITVINGDAKVVLAGLPEASVDGAITSPPYYNAREYSQWPNIYTYLYDMYNITRAVFRVLRPGSYYLFNIFDYFDNENNVALSAMGNKRMILGAYTVDMFRRAGFLCCGNVVWDKGDIEGKRGFNNGNFSPYYQAPFNCWEHVFVFRKPDGESARRITFPTVLHQKPVIKIVRGENVHGHTAPFPEALPRLLTDMLPAGSTVLDPFAGSMTTALAARASGLSAICIEKDRGYFELGIRKLNERGRQPALI